MTLSFVFWILFTLAMWLTGAVYTTKFHNYLHKEMSRKATIDLLYANLIFWPLCMFLIIFGMFAYYVVEFIGYKKEDA